MKNYRLFLPALTFSLGPIFSFIFLPFITRNISIEQYGKYTFYLSFLSLISFFSLFPALNSTVNRYGSSSSKNYVSNIFFIRRFYFFSFLVYISCVVFIVFFYEDITKKDFFFVAMAILSINIFNMVKSYLLINNRKNEYSLLVIVIVFSQYSYLFYAISRGDGTVADILFGNVLLLFLFFIFKNKAFFCFLKNKPDCKQSSDAIFRFLMASFFISLSTVIYNNTDKIMMEHMLDDARYLALYQVSYQIFSFPVESIYTFVSIFIPAFLYRAFDKNKKLYFENLRITLKIVFLLIFVLTQLLFINKDYLKGVLLDEEYIANDALPFLFLLSQSFFLIYLVVSNVFIVHNKRIYIIVILSVSSFLNMLLNYFFIPQYGYVGAALSTLISYFVLLVLVLYISKRSFNIIFLDFSDLIFFSSVPAIYYFCNQNYYLWMSCVLIFSFLYFKVNVLNGLKSFLKGV